MRLGAIVGAIAATIGGGLTLYAGFRIVEGPFMTGAPADPVSLVLSVTGFLVGIIVLAWGVIRVAGVGARI